MISVFDRLYTETISRFHKISRLGEAAEKTGTQVDLKIQRSAQRFSTAIFLLPQNDREKRFASFWLGAVGKRLAPSLPIPRCSDARLIVAVELPGECRPGTARRCQRLAGGRATVAYQGSYRRKGVSRDETTSLS
jgi:hypothetical protein